MLYQEHTVSESKKSATGCKYRNLYKYIVIFVIRSVIVTQSKSHRTFVSCTYAFLLYNNNGEYYCHLKTEE